MGANKCTSRPSDSQRHLPNSLTNYVPGCGLTHSMPLSCRVVLAAVLTNTKAYAVEYI
jgi:hypothetical protein